MKTFPCLALFSLVLALAAGTSALAQNHPGPGGPGGPHHAPPALNADGTLTLPDGTIVTPNADGSITLPDGRVLPPPPKRNADGTITLPDGTVVTPNGDGTLTLPDGTVVKGPPDGPGRGPGPARPTSGS